MKMRLIDKVTPENWHLHDMEEYVRQVKQEIKELEERNKRQADWLTELFNKHPEDAPQDDGYDPEFRVEDFQ